MGRTKTAPAYRDSLEELRLQGRAQLLATLTDAINPNTRADIINTDDGEVAIIEKVVCTCFGARDSSPAVALSESQGFELLDNDDQPFGDARFLIFERHNSVFVGAATPDWQSAQPCKPVAWQPQDPIVVPPNCHVVPLQLSPTVTNDMAGGNFMFMGYRLSLDDALRLGFAVPRIDVIQTSPINLLATMRTGMESLEFTASAVTLVAGRAGQHLQILDMFIRAQPVTHAPTFSFTVRQVDDTVIFKGCNNNPSDLAEWDMSPGIYLDAGQGIEIIGDTNIRATITVRYRFVDPDDVPQDHWWAYVDVGAQLPSPGDATTGVISTFVVGGVAVVPYYPKTAATKAAPEAGKQHIVEGYAISVQKDLTAAPDQVFFALTTGAAGGSGNTSIGVAGTLGTAPLNHLISPIFAANAHDQCLFWTENDAQAAGAEGDSAGTAGQLWIDVSATGETNTPAASDLDVDEMHCLVWGRTTPVTVRNVDRHYEGNLT